MEGGSNADVVAVPEGVGIVRQSRWNHRGQVIGIGEREAAARTREAVGGGRTVGVQGRIYWDAVRGAGVIDREGGGAVGTPGRIYRDAMGRAVVIYRDRRGDGYHRDRQHRHRDHRDR